MDEYAFPLPCLKGDGSIALLRRTAPPMEVRQYNLGFSVKLVRCADKQYVSENRSAVVTESSYHRLPRTEQFCLEVRLQREVSRLRCQILLLGRL
jgi:hypothetical protein